LTRRHWNNLIPVSQGGPRSAKWNLDISCKKCNSTKASTILVRDALEIEMERAINGQCPLVIMSEMVMSFA
jgi:hypothetical protein